MNRSPFRSNTYQFARPASQSPRIAPRRRGTKSSHSMFSDQRAQRRFPVGWIFLILLSVVLFIAAYSVIDNNIVRIENVQVTLPGMDKIYEGFTILHISDLHGKRFGSEQKQLATTLRNARYNAVCITGDMTGPDGDPHAFYELLDILDSSKPIFFIAGDEDPTAIIGEPHYTNDVLAEFILGAQRKGVIYLDAPQKIQYGGGTLWIVPESQLSLDLDAAEQRYRNQLRQDQEGGNSHLAGIKARERMLNYQLDVLERVRAARAEMTANDMHIALVHHPLRADFIRTLQSWMLSTGSSYARTLDLVLAGHYNGGQARLPFLGPIKVPENGGELPRSGWFPGDSRVHGLSQVAGVAQYINAGLGVSSAYTAPFRMFNSPRVALIRLTTSLTQQ